MKPLKHSVTFNIQYGNKSKESIPIRAWVTFNSQLFPFNTGIRINKKYWSNKTKWPIATIEFADYQKTVDSLESVKDWVKIVFENLTKGTNQYPDLATFKRRCEEMISHNGEIPDGKQPIIHDNLVDYIQHVIDKSKAGKRTLRNGKSYANATLKNYNTLKNALKRYLEEKKKPLLTFNDVDVEFYNDFQDFIYYKEEKSDNYFGTLVKNIKVIMNEALEEGLHQNLKYKSKRFKKVQLEVDNIYLNADQLDKLYKHDFSKNSRLDRVRDLFLVGCWTGLRFSDFTNIKAKNIQGDFISIKTQKTGEPVIIPIHETVRAIMQKYKDITTNSLPPALSNVKMNLYIKEAVKEAKITDAISIERTRAGVTTIEQQTTDELVSTHTARRSFASNMFKQGVPSILIMAVTGHRTEKAFMKYIKATPKEKAEMMKEIWNRKA
jgi:integrase